MGERRGDNLRLTELPDKGSPTSQLLLVHYLLTLSSNTIPGVAAGRRRRRKRKKPLH